MTLKCNIRATCLFSITQKGTGPFQLSMIKLFAKIKETQTFKTYKTESYKYCSFIAGSNTEISKTHKLLKKILFFLCPSLCLLRLFRDFIAFFAFLNLISWTKSQWIIRAVSSFIFWLENCFLHVKPARYHSLHKKLCLQ